MVQVYKQNDRLVQHIAKQHADELPAADAADPKVIARLFAESAPPPIPLFMLAPTHTAPSGCA